MVTAVFRHDTPQALDSRQHSHCIITNAAFEPLENREMYVARKYAKNVYSHEQARSVTGSQTMPA